ncbi:MAG: hypothetical protein JJU34_14910 [Lunatimonas sp.]|uniref:hypothetical protein n=1 Tax=Lunatimonas sp. TaxID=2060141 RepID=UPI00263A9AA6|nr:hypothetical protein [Lunatimonas sp.]MCC5938568.1 hypothetical protein [Lunatimonas sp.]
MKSIWIILAVWSPLFLSSCGGGESQVEALKREVIGVHDEVMPLMGELKTYQRSLTEKAAELKEQGIDAAEVSAFEEAAKACADAYDGMFVWMRQFDPKVEDMEESEAIRYLEDQEKKVAVVNLDIKKALEQAEILLEK